MTDRSDYMRDYYVRYVRPSKGARPLVDADPVREHVRTCQAAGMSPAAIARSAGVSASTLSRIMRLRIVRLQAPVADRILAVQPRRPVSAIGLTRRVRALAARGWSVTQIARAGGLNLDTVKEYRRGTVLAPKPRAVAGILTAYAQLSMATPPERTRWERNAVAGVRTRAARAAWAVPLQWDDEEIDDPSAQPHDTEPAPRTNPRQRVHLDALELLIDEGLTAANIAARLGCSIDAIWTYLRRHGRSDLLEQLRRQAAA